MGGLIEDDDAPGAPSFRLATVYRVSSPAAPPEIDVEMLVDRLRLMGVDPEVVAEAHRRLGVDLQNGYHWLREHLQQLGPQRKPASCCGAPLVEAGWRGKSTIRCDQCGARWGVEIGPESEAVWSLSGPSDEWRAAHPVEEDLRCDDFPPEAVLEHGLPPMPIGIDRGDWLPLAFWRDERFGAVLYVHRSEAEEFDSPDEYESEIEYLRRDPDGGWMTGGSGGGGWINPFAPPEDLLHKYVLFGTGIAGFHGEIEINFTGGLCREDVASVEVADTEGVKRYPVDHARRTFVVGAYGPGSRVRLLDRAGGPILGWGEEPATFALG